MRRAVRIPLVFGSLYIERPRWHARLPRQWYCPDGLQPGCVVKLRRTLTDDGCCPGCGRSLRRDLPSGHPDPDNVGQGGIDAGWYER